MKGNNLMWSIWERRGLLRGGQGSEPGDRKGITSLGSGRGNVEDAQNLVPNPPVPSAASAFSEDSHPGVYLAGAPAVAAGRRARRLWPWRVTRGAEQLALALVCEPHCNALINQLVQTWLATSLVFPPLGE